MTDLLTEPLRDGITQRAILELLILAVVCGPLGVWVVLYRQSYATESIAHSMLPGLVIASLASIPLGLGTLLALSPDVPVRLGEILFGDPLAVSAGDLAASAALAVVTLLALARGHRSLTLSGFDPQTARNLGGGNQRAAALLLSLLALTVLIAVGSLGNLLVVAIVIGPGAAALRIARSLTGALWIAAAAAAFAGVAGIYLSYWAELAAGASIAICAVAVFALAMAMSRLTGRPAVS